MTDILNLVLPYFIIILIGFCVEKWRSLGRQALEWMNAFIIYVALPALFFRLIMQTPIDEFSNWRFILLTTSGTLIIYTLSLLLGMIYGGATLKTATIQGFCGAYSNIGYMGIGMCLSVFGHEAVVPIALVFCFDNALHFIVAPLLMSVATSRNSSLARTLGLTVRKVLSHPFILATLAGLAAAASGIQLPNVISTTLDHLANTAAPSALFVLGVTLALTKVKRWTAPMSCLLVIKMGLHPALMFFLLTSFTSFPPMWVGVAILMSALPVALNVFVLSEQYQVYSAETSSLILVSTLLSVISVPVIIHLIRAFLS